MSYNPAKDAPRTEEQLEICIDYFLDLEWQKAASDKDYQPKTREDLERMYEIFLTPEQPDAPEFTPEQLRQQKIDAIDSETSSAILAGFDYAVNGETLHFNYDSFDQQNFADTANACILAKNGVEGLPESVTWNGYKSDGTLVRLTLTADDFLALYTRGALAHKAACMESGGQKKAELA